MIELRARTADEVSLSVRAFPAPGPRAIMVCGHAMMANGRYMHKPAVSFAEYMAGEGVSTYVFDFRAHGQSVPPAPERSSTHSFDTYVQQDLPAVMAEVAEHAGVERGELGYLGHSLGGNVALAAIASGTITAPRRLSLWAASLWLEGPSGSRKRRLLMRSYQAMAHVFGSAPIRRLGLGSDDESYSYVRQMNAWCQSGRWSSLAGVDYEQGLASIEVPTLGVVGAGDRLCSPAGANRFLCQLPRSRPLRVVGTEFGDAFDPDHFTLFTDARMQPVWRELAAFMVGDD